MEERFPFDGVVNKISQRPWPEQYEAPAFKPGFMTAFQV
jgi:hypothetical protein